MSIKISFELNFFLDDIEVNIYEVDETDNLIWEANVQNIAVAPNNHAIFFKWVRLFFVIFLNYSDKLKIKHVPYIVYLLIFFIISFLNLFQFNDTWLIFIE